MENLTLEYMEAFGSRLGVDPSVFATQIQSINWEAKDWENNTPKLLYSRNPAELFTLRYVELLRFDKEIAYEKYLRDASAGRQITATRHLGCPFDNVGMVRRCASFWRQETKENGWNGNLPLPLLEPLVT